ncbi:MAG: hypothetical protein HUK20_04285 [Fibrobacter sp.]|nr:hypothetical protein [Fibrobacter sp.]
MGVSCIFALSACDNEQVTMNYSLSEPIDVELYSEGYFSTYDLENVEQMGTITAAYVDLHYSSDGENLKLKRNYIIDKSRGYLKNYMPSELVWRIKEVETIAHDQEVKSISGLEDGYDTLVSHIPMPERWRTQLLNKDYKPHLLRAEKHRWEMDHILTGTIPSRANITQILKDRGRLNFALIQIDSVVTDGFHNLDKRKCLGYTVYLHEKESFPYYIWEQHVNSKIVPEKFQSYNKGIAAEYSTAFWIALDPNTGIPCQEREVKEGINTMVNPETKDTVTFKSHVTLERLFTVRHPGENNE